MIEANARRLARLSPEEFETILGEVTRRLVEAAPGATIILFGSYARGDFDARSDLDILVILPHVESRFEEMARLRMALSGVPMAFDLVVYSTEQVRERRKLKGTMLYHALQEGRVLHDGT